MSQGDKCAQIQALPERFSAYVVIPSSVFFDRELSERARLLYGLLSCMSNHKGYCWAKNETIGRYLSVDERTVRRHLKELQDRGHILIQQRNDGGTTVRQIHMAALTDRPDKSVHPPGQICPDRPDKSVHQNNININNIPPIVPLEGDSSEQQQQQQKKQRRTRRKAGQAVELPPELEARWNIFYDAYPVKKDKQKARERWLALAPDDAMTQMIVGSIMQLSASDPDWQKGTIPHPSTFLNNRRWEDVENLGMVPEADTTARGMKIL